MMRMIAFAAVAGCVSTTPGAQPHDMSASQHEAAAREHERLASDRTVHDATTRSRDPNCRPNIPRPAMCWTSVENPTDEHRRMVEAHRSAAADHRAASQALRTAEAAACDGLVNEDRDSSPFDRVEDIAAVEVDREMSSRKPYGPRVVGLAVTFRARPGMTAEWLQRIVDCHIARNAALGHEVPEMADCPLVPHVREARVASVGNGFVVRVRAADPDALRDILARGRRLAGRAGVEVRP